MFRANNKVTHSVNGLTLLVLLSSFVVGSTIISVQVDSVQGQTTEFSTMLLDIEEIIDISWVDVDTNFDSYSNDLMLDSYQDPTFSSKGIYRLFMKDDCVIVDDSLVNPYILYTGLHNQRITLQRSFLALLFSFFTLFFQLLVNLNLIESSKDIFSFFSFFVAIFVLLWRIKIWLFQFQMT